MKFRKKPVVIEATQWFKNGDHPNDYDKDHDGLENGALRVFTGAERKANDWEGDVVRYYRHPDVPGDRSCEQCGKPHHVHGWIDTLEQGHRVCPGDWIITGVKGERYPCKPDIFEATYQAASLATTPAIPDGSMAYDFPGDAIVYRHVDLVAYGEACAISAAAGRHDIKAMAARFCGWPLPKTFSPDGGITFKYEPDARGFKPSWPIGTNLFTDAEAREMFAYCLAAPVEAEADPAPAHNLPKPWGTWSDSDRLLHLYTSEQVVELLSTPDVSARRLEIFIAERDIARAQYDYLFKVLMGIHLLLSVEDIKLPDGRVFRFNDPNAAETLRELTARIRAIPESIKFDYGATAVRDVLAERRRQKDVEGWTPEHDDEHGDGQLAVAAACYAVENSQRLAAKPPPSWPWDASWWKPKGNRRNLVRAGALILSEIERIDRATARAALNQKGGVA